MSAAWQVLIDAGAPLAGKRGAAPSPERLAAAVLDVLSGESPSGRESDALAALILAWRQHWPTSFAGALAGEAGRVEQWARANRGTPDRHVKLRRIAIEQLASVL